MCVVFGRAVDFTGGHCKNGYYFIPTHCQAPKHLACGEKVKEELVLGWHAQEASRDCYFVRQAPRVLM